MGQVSIDWGMPTANPFAQAKSPDIAGAFSQGFQQSRDNAFQDEQRSWVRDQRQHEVEQRRAQKEAGQLYASGDLKGAENRLASSGNMRAAYELNEQNYSRAERAHKVLMQFGGILAEAKTPEEFEEARKLALKHGANLDAYSHPSWERNRDHLRIVLNREAQTLQREMDRAKLRLTQAQASQAEAKPTWETKEINGKLVAVSPDRTSVKELYDGGTNFDKLPEYSAKAAGFATRMVDAERNLRDSMSSPSDFDPSSAWAAAARAAPESVSNYMMRSGHHQRYMQAAEQWIRAFLRKESGAAIGKDEFERDFKVYFPQPGDTPGVIAQKEAARLAAVGSFRGETRGYFDHASPKHAAEYRTWAAEDERKRSEAAAMRTYGPPNPASGPTPQAGTQQPVPVRTPDEARRLPSGTPILLPDGTLGRVP